MNDDRFTGEREPQNSVAMAFPNQPIAKLIIYLFLFIWIYGGETGGGEWLAPPCDSMHALSVCVCLWRANYNFTLIDSNSFVIALNDKPDARVVGTSTESNYLAIFRLI